MSDERRSSPFIWVTWLTGLLAGDQQCQFAAWYRAHHTYDKRPDAKRAELVQWKADHADAVRARMAALRTAGWGVTVEDQNKFVVRGQTATLSGCPDLVATAGTDLRVEDCKTGAPKDAHYWQVAIYMMFSPAVVDFLKRGGEKVTGVVVYPGSTLEFTEPPNGRARVLAAIRMAASDQPPMPEPSAHECGRCDIAACAYRVSGDAAEHVTDEF